MKWSITRFSLYKRYLPAVSGAVLFVITLVHFFMHPLTITPGETSLEIEPYSDRQDYTTDTGGSRIEHLQTKPGRVACTYRIGENREFPYVGIALSPPDTGFWDLSSYDRVHIDVNERITAPFTFLCATMVAGFSNPENGLSWRLFQDDINEISSTVTLPLSRMETPTWWFQSNSIPQNRNRESLGKVRQIRFQNHPMSPPKTSLHLQVHRIRFTRSPRRYIVWWVVSGLLACSIFIPGRSSFPRYSPLRLEPRASEDLTIIEEYIGEHYNRLDVSLQTAVRETGLSEKRIRTVLDRRWGMGFKKYVDTIRMKEAARLLCESDRQINEIALYTGYRHPTTFAKIFRRIQGCSPREYRKKHLRS
ncbi:MAG: helix-turn-helix domain-containing protein [Fibrobacterota bacterium]